MVFTELVGPCPVFVVGDQMGAVPSVMPSGFGVFLSVGDALFLGRDSGDAMSVTLRASVFRW